MLFHCLKRFVRVRLCMCCVLVGASVCVWGCACVCVCVCERESLCLCLLLFLCVCVCACKHTQTLSLTHTHIRTYISTPFRAYKQYMPITPHLEHFSINSFYIAIQKAKKYLTIYDFLCLFLKLLKKW